MKRGCQNGLHNVNDPVYFMVVADEKPYVVKYDIREKIECRQGFSYVIDTAPQQDEPELDALVEQKRIGTNFRVCGDSLFKTKGDAVKKARESFEKILAHLDTDTK
jgi:hypothetical protein